MSSPARSTPASPVPHGAAPDGPKTVCVRTLHLMADGGLSDFEAVIHPAATNREARTGPVASRGQGPAAFYATALRLRGAFSGMRFDIHQVAGDGDLVVVHCTLSGRHNGPFPSYDDTGAVSQVMPPTGRTFAGTQTHWFRCADGKVIEHWANRDDLTMARQAGWIPPSPFYLARMALAKRRARATEAQKATAA